MEMYFNIKYVLDSDEYSEVEELEEISQIMGFDVSNNSSFFEWFMGDSYFDSITSSSDSFNEPLESINEVLDYPIIISSFRAIYGISEHDFWQLSVPEYKRLLLGLQLQNNPLGKLVENRNLVIDNKDDVKVKEQKSIIKRTYAIKSTEKTKYRLNQMASSQIERKKKLNELMNSKEKVGVFGGK